MRTFLAALFLAVPAFAVGTVQQSIAQLGTSNNWVLTFNWTGDSSSGTVPVTPSVLGSCCQGYLITQAETVPRSPAPTSGYSVAITDSAGVDALGGGAVTVSSTIAQSFVASPSTPPLQGALNLVITGQSVAGAKGIVYVFLSKPGSINLASLAPASLSTGIPFMSCYPTSTCSIAGTGGRLIWTNPSASPAGVTAGLKINVSDHIAATPSAGDLISFQAITTNDGFRSANLWGADILGLQEYATYTGPASIVVSGGIATATTPTAHNLFCDSGFCSFVNFSGMSLTQLNTQYSIASIVSPTVFTFATGSPSGSSTGTMWVTTHINGLEVEAGNKCNSTNYQGDPWGGTGCRTIGLGLTAIGGSGQSTAALQTYAASTDSSQFWDYGAAFGRNKKAGIYFKELDSPAKSFAVGAIWDDSSSANVLEVSGTHQNIVDFPNILGLNNVFNIGSATFTNFVLGTGSNPINFNGVKVSITGPAGDGSSNESLHTNSNGAVFVNRRSAAGDLEIGGTAVNAVSILAGGSQALYLHPSLQWVGIHAPAAAPSTNAASQCAFYLDEIGNNLKAVCEYSNGSTVKTFTGALL